jgi:hypothetical protein
MQKGQRGERRRGVIMTEIRMNPTIVKQALKGFVDELHKLKWHVGIEGSIDSCEELKNDFKKLQNLNTCVAEYLRSGKFTDDRPASEYDKLVLEPIDDDRIWLENQQVLVVAIERRAMWLRNLCRTIDNVKKSDNVITVDGGCEKGAY